MSEAELPLALVSIAVGPLVLPVSVRLVLHPLSDVAIARNTLPYSVSMFDAVDPFTIVSVASHPSVEALATDGSLIVLA